MASFHDIQAALDRILGNASPGNHGAFWRGKTRDEFVAHAVFGLPIIAMGDPGSSNLIRALMGQAPFGLDLDPPTPGSFLPRMPARQPPAAEADIALIEGWIAEGCPEEAQLAFAAAEQRFPTDDDHVRFWREMDLFFLLASPETAVHVDRMHLLAFGAWRASNIGGQGPEIWDAYSARPEVIESFEYIRFHQHRLLHEFYAQSQSALLDSLWKFGGDLLPRDPNSGLLPERRMNGPTDWFVWIPYLDMSLRPAELSETDVALARAWQVGVVADGLLRRRIPIPDFEADDPNVKEQVLAAFEGSAPADLLAGMLRRAKDFFLIA